MIGLLRIPRSQNGRRLINLLMAILIMMLLLSGCEGDWLVGYGRGDWTENLIGGYAIDKINSQDIEFIHKESYDDSGGTFSISNFLVVGYQIQEPYILLEGIHMQGWRVTEEELQAGVLSYCIVNAENDDILGPFETQNEFEAHCDALEITNYGEWIKVDPKRYR